MAGAKTINKNAGRKGTQRDRFLVGTDTPVLRLQTTKGGKSRFVWAVKDGEGFKHVDASETELR